VLEPFLAFGPSKPVPNMFLPRPTLYRRNPEHLGRDTGECSLFLYDWRSPESQNPPSLALPEFG
jgi:hypothetical protein